MGDVHIDEEEASFLVERFLEENAVADKAAEILRGAGPLVQMRVLERGSLGECRNPAGALISRVNKAAEEFGAPHRPIINPTREKGKGKGDGKDKGKGSYGGFAKGKGQDDWGSKSQDWGGGYDGYGHGKGDEGWYGLGREWDDVIMRKAEGKALAIVKGGLGKAYGSNNDWGTDSWDQGKGSADIYPPAKRMRIDTGKSGDGGKWAPAGKGKGGNGKVEPFLSENYDVSEKAANILREAPPDVQDVVIERGSLVGTQNPSGALISRVNQAATALGLKGEGKGA